MHTFEYINTYFLCPSFSLNSALSTFIFHTFVLLWCCFSSPWDDTLKSWASAKSQDQGKMCLSGSSHPWATFAGQWIKIFFSFCKWEETECSPMPTENFCIDGRKNQLSTCYEETLDNGLFQKAGLVKTGSSSTLSWGKCWVYSSRNWDHFNAEVVTVVS